MTPPNASAPSLPRRRLRNYLLDARFQLKAAVLIVASALPVAVLLGVFLWRTSGQLLDEAQKAVDARSAAALTSKELGAAALNNDLLASFGDPEFQERLKKESREIDARYEKERDAILAQLDHLKRRQQVVGWTIVLGLLALLAFIAAGSIVASHKIAGPVYRLKRLMQQVGTGQYEGISRLRKGDELQDLFLEFQKMVEQLNASQGAAVDSIAALIERARAAQVPAAIIEELQALLAAAEKRKIVFVDPDVEKKGTG